MFVGSGVKNGDEIALTCDQGEVVLLAANVKYKSNPPDLMECDLMPNDQVHEPAGSNLNQHDK